MLPTFIIIGATNAGTTSLYHYLGAHPDVIPSSIKEPSFFKTDKDFNKGLDWYKSLFEGVGKFAFEATTNYTKRHLYPGIPERMHSVLPDIKLIYLIRDPIERTITHYVSQYKMRWESRTFSEVIKDPDSHIVLTSKYFYQIQAFLDYYSKDQIMIVDSARLKKDTSSLVSDVFEFLGIPPYQDKDLFEKKFNKSQNKKQITKLHSVLNNKIKNHEIHEFIRVSSKPFRDFIATFKKPVERPRLTEEDREILERELKPDADKMRKFSGLDFSHWSV